MRETQTTRRKFMMGVAAAGTFGDGDDGLLPDLSELLGNDEQGEYTVKFGTREEFKTTDPEKDTAFIIEDTWEIHRSVKDTKDQAGYVWERIKPTGAEPTFQSATVEGPMDAESVSSGSVSTEQVGSARYFAGAFSGSNPDTRLDNALSAASNGDTIYLEAATYTTNRTIGTAVSLISGGGAYSGGAKLDAVWSIAARVKISGFTNATSSAEISLDSGSDASVIENCEFNSSTAITVNVVNVRYVNNSLGDVTFASGTGGGLVDACRGTTVTDNDGSNTVGDIS